MGLNMNANNLAKKFKELQMKKLLTFKILLLRVQIMNAHKNQELVYSPAKKYRHNGMPLINVHIFWVSVTKLSFKQ